MKVPVKNDAHTMPISMYMALGGAGGHDSFLSTHRSEYQYEKPVNAANSAKKVNSKYIKKIAKATHSKVLAMAVLREFIPQRLSRTKSGRLGGPL